MEDTSAVYVHKACKIYGKNVVLRDLDMVVQRGHIYGLLGSSGCGKTTLLWGIVGKHKFDSGVVKVFGGKPGKESTKVGYMPQEMALVGNLTVKDMIFYFGRIMLMSEKLIHQRLEELSDLLNLPPHDRFVKNCSGGEQRRISFAVALVNLPELLILDEPTVGVDPVLRERIWEFLLRISRKERITVIITTHYIEETRQADMIGLMRNGKLLAQDTPNELLRRYECEYLEEVFFLLSKRQEAGQECEVVIHQNSGEDLVVSSFEIADGSTEVLAAEKKSRKKRSIRQDDILSTKRMKALLDKNWKKFYRNYGGIAFIMVLPIVQLVFYFYGIGEDIKGIKVAMINDESSDRCMDFKFNESVVPSDDGICYMHDLGCRFMHYLKDPMILPVEYPSLEAAIDGIYHGKVTAAMHMTKNFSETFELRFHNFKAVTPEIFDDSQVNVYMDMSDYAIGLSVQKKLLESYLQFQKDLLKECKSSPKVAEPMVLKAIYGGLFDPITQSMLPGVFLSVLTFSASSLTAETIITDRTDGVFDRSIIAGVTSFELVITHFILQGAVAGVVTIEMLVIIFACFSVPYVGSIWVLTLIAYLQACAGLCFGFLLSTVTSDFFFMNVLLSGSFYILLLASGVIWPLQSTPWYFKWISWLSPFTVPQESFRNVMKKGWTIDNYQVHNGMLVQTAWIVVLIAVSTLLVKLKMRIAYAGFKSQPK